MKEIVFNLVNLQSLDQETGEVQNIHVFSQSETAYLISPWSALKVTRRSVGQAPRPKKIGFDYEYMFVSPFETNTEIQNTLICTNGFFYLDNPSPPSFEGEKIKNVPEDAFFKHRSNLEINFLTRKSYKNGKIL
jgi:hypothetical protein